MVRVRDGRLEHLAHRHGGRAGAEGEDRLGVRDGLAAHQVGHEPSLARRGAHVLRPGADDGTLFVSESTGGPIKIIGPKGEKSTLDLPKSEGESDPKPGRMTLDRDGCLYVVDRANCRVCVFDKERKIKLQFGRAGGKRGEFKELQDVAVDRQGRIYVLDSSGTPVQVFDKKGKYVYRFGFRGEGGEDISFPSALFLDQNDQVWVVDRGRHAFKVFDRSGSFLRSEGTYGLEEGYLFQPADAEMDSLGRIYVVEAGARRLQVFSLDRPFEPFSPPGL